MSFWAGILLKREAILLIDRLEMDGGERRFFRSPMARRVAHRKYIRLSASAFLLAAGSRYAAEEIGKPISEHFGDEPISPVSLLNFQGEFQRRSRETWSGVKGLYSETLDRIGAGVPTVDCLLCCMGPLGRPYLVTFDEPNDFRFSIREAPASWSICAMGPLEKEIGDRVRHFLTMAMGKPVEEQRQIAKDVLTRLVLWVSSNNRFVSPTYDMIFIGPDGTETFHFGISKGLAFFLKTFFSRRICERL